MEIGESKHSKTKSATARHVTNIPWIVFLVFLLWNMINTKMFPISPMTNTMIIIVTKIHHFQVFSILLFRYVPYYSPCQMRLWKPECSFVTVLSMYSAFQKSTPFENLTNLTSWLAVVFVRYKTNDNYNILTVHFESLCKRCLWKKGSCNGLLCSMVGFHIQVDLLVASVLMLFSVCLVQSLPPSVDQ